MHRLLFFFGTTSMNAGWSRTVESSPSDLAMAGGARAGTSLGLRRPMVQLKHMRTFLVRHGPAGAILVDEHDPEESRLGSTLDQEMRPAGPFDVSRGNRGSSRVNTGGLSFVSLEKRRDWQSSSRIAMLSWRESPSRPARGPLTSVGRSDRRRATRAAE
jgi:hypothetical protein